MLLSHELGQELSIEDVAERIRKLRTYLREKENKTATLEYSLFYMREILEKQYEKKYGKK